MTISVMESEHEEMTKYLQLIATICISDTFSSLRKELEQTYKKNGNEQAAKLAFQDALYAILVEEEKEYLDKCSY